MLNPIIMNKDYLQYNSGKAFKVIHNQLLKGNKLTNFQANAFFEAYMEDLNYFYVKKGEDAKTDVEVLATERFKNNKLINYLFVGALEAFVEAGLKTDVLIEFLTGLFRRANWACSTPEGMEENNELWIIKSYEHLLAISAVLVRKHKFAQLRTILEHRFIHVFKSQTKAVEHYFTQINEPAKSFDQNRQLKQGVPNVTASIILDCASSKYTNDLIDVDLLLYYVFMLEDSLFRGDDNWWGYFPRLSCYFLRPFVIGVRMEEKSYFDEIKVLFGCETKEDFFDKVKAVKHDNVSSGYNYQLVKDAFKFDKIATK